MRKTGLYKEQPLIIIIIMSKTHRAHQGNVGPCAVGMIINEVIVPVVWRQVDVYHVAIDTSHCPVHAPVC